MARHDLDLLAPGPHLPDDAADPDRQRLSLAVADIVRQLAAQLRCVDARDMETGMHAIWDLGPTA